MILFSRAQGGVELTSCCVVVTPHLFIFTEVSKIMNDIISKIVEMDEKARDLNYEILESKLDHEKEVVAAKENIINDYLERAKKHIKLNAQSEREAAEKTLAETRAAHAKIEKKLDEIFAANCDRWVDEIFNRVISG